jgi:hypothetical protein
VIDMGYASDDRQESPNNIEVINETQQNTAGLNKDKMKAFIKRKLKPVHQEIIAPPGQ